MIESQDYDQLLAEVGESFRSVRERQGWSVAEIAVIAGLEEPVVRAIETGECTYTTDTLWQMLSALGFAGVPPGRRRVPFDE